VTATGPGTAGTDRVEELVISATGGKFALEYGGELTAELNFDATAESVKSALNNLNSIKTAGGEVKGGGMVEVTGGPASTNPFKITYEGALGDEQQSAITVKEISLTDGSWQANETPQGIPAFETCSVDKGDICRRKGASGEGSGEFVEPEAIAVDNSCALHKPELTESTTPTCKEFDPFYTDVYVLDKAHPTDAVQVFSANGDFITSFGEAGGSPKNQPGKLHSPRYGGIAVDSNGNVYVADNYPANESEARIAIFRPKNGGYEYASEIPVATGLEGHRPQKVEVDASGDVFVTSEEEFVYKYLPGESVPVCRSPVPHPNLAGFAIDGETGDSFVYSDKLEMFYRFTGACQGDVLGVPEHDAEFPGAAGEKNTEGLAFNPGLRFPECVRQAGGKYGDGGCSKEGVPNEYELVERRPRGVLYAVNPGSGPRSGLIFAQSVVQSPVVVGESVSGVGGGGATLGGRIETHNNETRFVFQYGPRKLGVSEECSVVTECREAPVGGGVLEAGKEDVSVTVSGLVPETQYYFRVVGFSNCNPEIVSEECVLTGGSERGFVTLGAGAGVPAPPDGRAYELVSPLLKDGGEVFPPATFANDCGGCVPGELDTRFPMQSSPDGDAMVYEGNPFTASGDAVNENEYFAARGDDGWESRDLSPALASNGSLQGYKAFAGDLSAGVLLQDQPSLSAETPAGYADLYLQDVASPGSVHPLVLEQPPHVSAASFGLVFAGASADFKHLVFAANDALVPGAPEGNNLYEWADGTLRLVNVLPGGTAESNAVFGSGVELAAPETKDPDFSHVISADGSRIFWTDENTELVYMRENGATTLRVPDVAKFLTASEDGSRVLLNDGKVFELGPGDEAFEQVENLSQGAGGFQGILGTSSDLSTVYFVDTAKLTGEEENSSQAKAVEGGFNVYRWQEGVAGVVFVTTLAAEDNGDYSFRHVGDWWASPSDRTAQVTSDGRYAAFMSRAKLTSYDNGGVTEVYEYDATSKQLVCASCNPSGERPVGPSSLSLIAPGSGFLPQPANLLASGRLFFDSLDELSPQDVNHRENVFEYQPAGFKAPDGLSECTRASGCILLVSSGTGPSDSNFVNATPSGSDVFFTTRTRLVAQDQDELVDLYDAREPHTPGERVGFPPVPVPPECGSAGECRSTSSSSSEPPGVFAAPLSGTLSGPGNLPLLSPSPPPVVKPLPPTRAQLLAKALKACQRKKGRRQRKACSTRAKHRFGSHAASTKTASSGRRNTKVAVR
jgi:hypothetical protein